MSQKRYGTRVTNVDKHPGNILKTSGDRKKRRTREEMAAALFEHEQEEKAAMEETTRLRLELAQMKAKLVAEEEERLQPSVPLEHHGQCIFNNLVTFNTDNSPLPARPKVKATGPVGKTAREEDALLIRGKGGPTGDSDTQAVSVSKVRKAGSSGTSQDNTDIVIVRELLSTSCSYSNLPGSYQHQTAVEGGEQKDVRKRKATDR